MPDSRSTWARTSACPASRPSAKPCSNASWCASACRSARPPTVAKFCCDRALPMSGTVHNATVAAGFALLSDKFAGSLAAQTDGALFGHALCDHDDFLLRGFDIGQFHRTACFHVVLEDLCRSLRHVLEDFLLHFRFCPTQCHGQGVGTHFAQQRLDAAIVDIEQIVEYEQQILDLLMHFAIGLFDLAELLAELFALNGIQHIRRAACDHHATQC